MRLRAYWAVSAGVIPDVPVQSYYKRWEYTDVDKEADDRIKEPWEVAIFAKKRAEAMDYYLQISLPNLVNWAKLEFMWM